MTTSAVDMLKNLIESGAFASRLEASLNCHFRHTDHANWYTEAVEAEGIEAAERRLARWVSQGHSDVFASSIEPVARGALALAKVRGDSLVDITNHATSRHSRINNRSGPRHEFVVFNQQSSDCCGIQPRGNHEWASDGEIGLQAVILETGYTSQGPTAIMTLVLPTWARNERKGQPNSMALVNLESDGYSTGDRAVISILQSKEDGAAEEEVTDPRLGLEYLLGITEPEGFLQVGGFLSGIHEALGFPSASGYLARELPVLGDYFIDLAEKLATSRH